MLFHCPGSHPVAESVSAHSRSRYLAFILFSSDPSADSGVEKRDTGDEAGATPDDRSLVMSLTSSRPGRKKTTTPCAASSDQGKRIFARKPEPKARYRYINAGRGSQENLHKALPKNRWDPAREGVCG